MKGMGIKRSCTIGLQYTAAIAMVLGIGGADAHAELDLTTAGSSGTINGAYFEQLNEKPKGSGVFGSFVRISSNDGMSEGYNTSGRIPGEQAPLDANNSPTFTHDLRLGDLETMDLHGVLHFFFRLDINEVGMGNDDALLSLDELMIYTSSIGSQTINDPADIGMLGALRYDLDGAGDTYIKLDERLGAGSGQGDMFAFIPVANFYNRPNAAKETDFVYLYSKFGSEGGHMAEHSGYEEWAVEIGPQVMIPEPSTYALLGGGMLALLAIRRRRS